MLITAIINNYTDLYNHEETSILKKANLWQFTTKTHTAFIPFAKTHAKGHQTYSTYFSLDPVSIFSNHDTMYGAVKYDR